MSLNRTLDRLFTEIRREAKRNPAFADRLDAVLLGHASGRTIDEGSLEAEPPAAPTPVAAAPLNPVAVLQKEGEEALRAALAPLDRAALAALIGEHNLDPAGAAVGGDEAALIAQILAQAQKRLARDKKLFDY